jgi:hypothetical protein
MRIDVKHSAHTGLTLVELMIYCNGVLGPQGVSCNYDPPEAYDYQWSGN